MVVSFRESLEKVQIALLINRLIQETEGLSSEEIEKIAKWKWFQYGGDNTPICQIPIDIKTCQTVEEFAEAATLTRKGVEHSWAGSNTYIELGDWIVGQGTFGFNKDLECTNGHNSTFDRENVLPEFNMDHNNVILVQSEDKDDFNGRNYYEEKWTLYILLKEGQLQIDDKIKKIMEEFNI